MSSETVSKVCDNEENALALAVRVALKSQWFEFKPLPNGQFQMTVSADNAALLEKEPKPTYILIQEGGSSLEHYLHSHDSADAAEEDRIECADNGAYRTSPVVMASPVIAELGERFYEPVESLISGMSNLECVDVPSQGLRT